MGKCVSRSDNHSTSIAVLEAVADEKEVDVSDIETPLAEVVDTDSLNSLWEPGTGTKRNPDGVLSFDYEGCRVIVKSDGTVDANLI